MTAGQRGFEIHAESAEARPRGAELHIFGAHVGVLRRTEGDGAAGVHFAEARHARIVGIQHRDAVGRQRFDQFALGQRQRLRWNRRTPRARSRRW